ncbi:uncharacterized protein B0I36DRAFT_328060, partial [Microdochium trichocladiopsis]
MTEEAFICDHGIGKPSGYRFVIETSPCGHREEFEWRKSHGEAIERLDGSCLGGWKLVRIGAFDKQGRSLKRHCKSIKHFPAYTEHHITPSSTSKRSSCTTSQQNERVELLRNQTFDDQTTPVQTDSDEEGDNFKLPSTDTITGTDGNEVVAAWVMSSRRQRLASCFTNTKKFRFAFYGTGASGVLGERFALMTLMTALRMWDLHRRSGTSLAYCRQLAGCC